MGYFRTFVCDAEGWAPREAGTVPDAAGPWLTIDIHDSDFTVISYRPSGPGTGIAYLGCTPRTYFEDDSASEPTDVSREAAGLAAWWELMRGGASAAERNAARDQFAAFLAADHLPGPDDDEAEESDDLDDGEIFVEIKTARLVAALGLPPNPELPSPAQ
jgi:hypothetical protein